MLRAHVIAGVAAFGIFAAVQARAVPVLPLPRTVAQPDGTTLTVVPAGDEFNLFWELPDGRTVVQDVDGWWRVATLDGEGRLVPLQSLPPGVLSAQGAAIARPHLRPTKVGKGSGELAPIPVGARSATVRSLAATQAIQPVLVILVQFTDQAPVAATAADFRDAFFGTGRSVAEYYHEATFGKLEMVPVADTQGVAGDGVVGWLSLPMEHPNKGLSGSSTATEEQKDEAGHNMRLAVKAAIQAADPYVDFSLYDRDHNGALSVDELAVVVITAGYESSYGGYKVAYKPANWGHRWALDGSDGVGVVAAPVVDGVTVGSFRWGGGYSSFGEWMQSTPGNGHRSTIGVMVHELGHDSLGLPDLYDTDDSSEGIGAWGLMGGGSWGTDGLAGQYGGEVPVLLCAWSRLATQISSPIDLSGSSSATALPAYSTGSVYRVGSGADNEYFLLEYRVPKGFDAGLKRYDATNFDSGGGLAVWHIDESVQAPSDGSVNDDETHKRVDLEEADGLDRLDSKSAMATRSMLYRGGGSTRFADDTTPDAHRYDGSPSGVVIDGVGQAGDAGIAFDYQAPNPVGFAADMCAAAFDVPLAPGGQRPLTENLVQATPGDTPALCAPLSAAAWYHVTPQRTGRLTIDAGGFDTVAAVLAGSCGSFTTLACNDDFNGQASRIVGVPVRRDEPVYVVVGRYDNKGDIGISQLSGSISLAAAAPLTVTSMQAEGCPRLDWRLAVSDGANPVAGLRAADVTLLIDGKEAPVAALTDLGGGIYEVVSYGATGGTATSYTARLEVDTDSASGEVETTVEEAGTACAGIASPTQTLVIPAAAHLVGAAGTNWRTDVLASAVGAAGSSVDLEVDYLEHGRGNPSPQRRVVAVGGGGASFGDAAAGLFGVEGGKGALLVKWQGEAAAQPGCESDCTGALRLTSRTYNLLGAGNEMGLPPGSTFGQEVPAVPVDDAIAPGSTAWITGLVEQPNGSRTNVGLVALGSAGATVQLHFTGPTGATLLDRSVALAGWEYLQIDRILRDVPGGVAVASMGITVQGGSAPVVAYASIADGQTGDPVALLPVRSAAATWYVPAAAHVTGVNDTNWRTDLAIFNPGSGAVSVTLAFLEEHKDNSTPLTSAPIVLPPGGSTLIGNVLPILFNRSGVKGALRVSADGGVVLSSRTYNLLLAGNRWNLPEGATFGQNVPAVTPADGLAAGQRGVVPGLVRDASYRSNAVLLNMSGSPATVEADVISSAGETLGAPVTMTLRPFEYGQIGDVVGAAGISGDVESGTLSVRVVSGQGPVNVFLSVADNRTGDPVTRVTQK